MTEEELAEKIKKFMSGEATPEDIEALMLKGHEDAVKYFNSEDNLTVTCENCSMCDAEDGLKESPGGDCCDNGAKKTDG